MTGRRAGFLSVVLLLAGARAAAAQDSVVVGVGRELSAPVGTEVTIPVYADLRKAPGVKLGSYTVRMTWNPSVLTYSGLDAGPFATPVERTDSLGAGVLYVAAVSVQGRDSIFDLFQLRLRYYNGTTSPIGLEVKELSGTAPAFTDLLATTTVVTPTQTFCPSVGRWGDLDDDDAANSRDALAILSNVVQLAVDTTVFKFWRADVDGDNKVDSRDALILLSYTVGVDIPGQRVLLVVAGACGGGAAPAISIYPDTADLVIGQSLRLIAQVRVPSGDSGQSAGVNWQVADPRVAIVDTAGVVTVRDTGTTWVTAAIGPGIKASVPVVGRQRRGKWHVDAARGAGSTVQTGTQRWPFGTPEDVFALLSEGDTILIAPGIHDYVDTTDAVPTYMTVGAVIMGDTSGGQPRPILRASPGSYVDALVWQGGRHGEVRNLVLRGFEYGVNLSGLRNIVVDNVRFEDINTSYYGYGFYSSQPIDTALIINSDFLGDSLSSSYGIYLGGARFASIRGSRIEQWASYGLYSSDVDSLEVVNNLFALNQNDGLHVASSNLPSVSAVISGNRFDRNNGSYQIEVSGGRTVTLDHNVLFSTAAGGVYVSASTDPRASNTTKRVSSLGDSISVRANGYYWMYLVGLDTAQVDSMVFEGTPDTLRTTYNQVTAKSATFTNSKFLNLSNEGLSFTGRNLQVDNTVFSGCSNACTWNNTYGIQAYASTDSGPAITLTNSTFYNLYYALYPGSSGDSAGPLIAKNNVVDSVSYGLYGRADSIVYQNNVLTRIRYVGLYTDRSGTNKPAEFAELSGNRITCSTDPSQSYGIQFYYSPGRIDSNTVVNCDYGIYATNSTSYPQFELLIRHDTVDMDPTTGQYGIYTIGRWLSTTSHNRVRGGTYGIYVNNYYVAGDSTRYQMDSNAVSLTRNAGMYLAPDNSINIYGQWNNVTNNQIYGIQQAGGNGLRVFTQGRLVGNTRYGVISSTAFNASANWWGDVLGPRCVGACNQSSAGDSLTTPTAVTFSGFLTADPQGVTVPLPSKGLPGPVAPVRTMAAVPAPAASPSISETTDRELAERSRLEARAQAFARAQAAAQARDADQERTIKQKWAELEQKRAARRFLRRQ